MNVAVICELNPLHNGHAKLFEYAKKRAEDGIFVAIMSGNYTQRGDLAICDKWPRAKSAMMAGADLVLEIPSVYAVQSAEYFAKAGVDIAKKLGFIDELIFGSESGDLDFLLNIANKISDLPHENELSSARNIENATGIRLNSNDILAVEYIKALRGTSIRPHCIKRLGDALETDNSIDYNNFASASSIRNYIYQNPDNIEKLDNVMPDYSVNLLKNSLIKEPATINSLSDFIILRLLELGPENISRFPAANSGLNNKVYLEAKTSKDIDEIIKNCTSKNYTSSRIRRILLATVTGADKKYIENGINVPYLRILGIKNEKKSIISKILYPTVIFGNFPSDEKIKNFPQDAREIISREIFATDVFEFINRTGKISREQCEYPVILPS